MTLDWGIFCECCCLKLCCHLADSCECIHRVRKDYTQLASLFASPSFRAHLFRIWTASHSLHCLALPTPPFKMLSGKKSIFLEFFSGDPARAPSCPPAKGASTRRWSYRNKYQWNHSRVCRRNFWQEPRGTYRIKLLSNDCGNQFPGGCVAAICLCSEGVHILHAPWQFVKESD